MMRIRSCIFLFGFLFCTVIINGTSLAAKLETEPSRSQITVVSADDSGTDPRLDQKVTYQIGCGRLSTVCADLTKMTKVTVRAGSNNNDWQVRDVPVVVSVKDFPLGRLIQALATATHSSLRVTTIESQTGRKEQVYRFSARNRSQELIKSSDARKDHEMVEIARAWDTIQYVGNSPELQAKCIASDPNRGELTVTFIKLLTALDQGAMDKLLAGDEVTVRASDNRYTALFRQLDALRWKTFASRLKKPDGGMIPQHTEAECDAQSLTIKLAQGGLSNFTDAIARVFPMDYGGIKAGLVMSVRDVDQRLQKMLGSDALPKPNTASTQKIESGRPADPNLLPINTDKDNQLQTLSRKIRLELPEDIEVPVYADELLALASSAQLNIVCEDFISQRCGLLIDVAGDFGKDTTAAALLKSTTERSFNTWFVEKDKNLLIGWANMGGSWQQCHANLVPASLVDGLLDKLDTGVEVDDITPVACLTPAQRNDWFVSNPRLMWASRAIHTGDEPIWRLYDSLSAAGKLVVKSEEGLPLQSIDPKVITGSLLDDKSKVKAATSLLVSTANSEAIASLLEEKVFSTAVIRLRSGFAKHQNMVVGKKLLKQRSVERTESEPVKDWDPALHHSCTLEFQAEKDGERVVVFASELQLSLPVYSIARERALIKSRQ